MKKGGWNSAVFLTVQLVLQLHCHKMAGIRTQASLLLCHVQPPSSLWPEQRTAGNCCLSLVFTCVLHNYYIIYVVKGHYQTVIHFAFHYLYVVLLLLHKKCETVVKRAENVKNPSKQHSTKLFTNKRPQKRGVKNNI